MIQCNDDADEVAGGGERPLCEKLPGNVRVKIFQGPSVKLVGAFEVHRLALDDPDQLERRGEGITPPIINLTCSFATEQFYYNEVRQAPLPNSFPDHTVVPRLHLPNLELGRSAAEQGRRPKQGGEI